MLDDFIGRPLDLLLGYEPGMPLPTVVTTMGRQWHPEDATPNPGTPGQARYVVNARTRNEDVWIQWRTNQVRAVKATTLAREIKYAKQKRKADDARRLKARVVVNKLIQSGVLDMSDMLPQDMERAEDALTILVSIAHDGKSNTKDRISAAKAILDFTRAKPASKTDVNVTNSLSWLDQAEADADRLLETNK